MVIKMSAVKYWNSGTEFFIYSVPENLKTVVFIYLAHCHTGHAVSLTVTE